MHPLQDGNIQASMKVPFMFRKPFVELHAVPYCVHVVGDGSPPVGLYFF